MRFCQAFVGLKTPKKTIIKIDKFLAFFWAPLEMILRPAYSADISSQIDFSNLQKYSDDSFEAEDPSAGGPGFLLQDYSYGYHSGAEGFGDFVRYNQASTQMPWTAMGYTYNWNYLEDGEAGRALDPNRVSSLVGPSEFVVSAGSWVEFSHFVENDALYAYLVPESGSFWLLAFATGMILMIRASRRAF